MAKLAKASLNESVAGAVKGTFNLEKFIQSKNLSSTSIKMKEQTWIPLSKAFQDCLSIPGIPVGHITLLRGHSDTGKTTALLEAAVSAQKIGFLPVFIITEMKWNWEHAKQMGLVFEEVPNEEGEVADYKGFFIYVDRERLNTIEDFINQKIVLSRKQSQPYTNTMLAVNKIWVAKAENIMAQPKMKNKGGDTMYFDASLIITFGNVTNSGTNKIKATKNGKDVEFAKRTKVSCDKNHVNDVTSTGRVIMTAHGFIDDTKQAIDAYKKQYSKDWLKTLGSVDFDVVIETDEDNKDVFDPTEE